MKALIILIAAVVNASVLSDAVSQMKERSFRPLTTVDAINNFRMGPLLEPVFNYSNEAVWDPLTRQILFCGAPHGVSQHMIAYDETSNAWRAGSMPSGVDFSGAHSYDHLTTDDMGIFYNLYWSNGTTYRFDTRANAWISPLPSTAAGFGSLDYFPDLNGLVRVVAGGVYLYRFNTGAWETVKTGLTNSNTSTVAHYSPGLKCLIFSGGGSALYKLDASLNVASLKPMPFVLNESNAHLTCDPVTGTLLVLDKDSLYEYLSASDTWRGVARNPIFNFNGLNMVSVPIHSYGVVAFLSDYQWPVLLYRHAGSTGMENAGPSLKNLDFSGPSIVYDIRGRVKARLGAGMAWNRAGVPAGIYYLRSLGKTGVTRPVAVY